MAWIGYPLCSTIFFGSNLKTHNLNEFWVPRLPGIVWKICPGKRAPEREKNSSKTFKLAQWFKIQFYL